MREVTFVHYLPILTTIISMVFSLLIYKRYRKFGGNHLLWWSWGVLVFGLGTFAESWITLLGWNVSIFRFWYIAGALLGGAPLAQGTVWLLLQPKTAKLLTIALILFVTVSAVFVLMSPIELDKVDPNLPSGTVFTWQWVRGFSPFINTYAVIFLIGGAIISALRYRKQIKDKSADAEIAHDRFIGNVFIAVGAILPGIGGGASRVGYTEVLYIGEFIGIMLIWTGYWFNTGKIDQRREELAAMGKAEFAE
ncbi:hypothetical protein E3V55_07495 [Candidatus Marinimicrobia bacterium MT.SAG.3]|nr:hypothetical protein E3V55_07495 [Candidatus Marinimicrobia bacterium MT.SAG.3]